MKLAILALAAALVIPVSAAAQTTTVPPQSNGFSASSEAVALHYNGEWSPGTIATESYDFLDFGKTKSNRIYLEGHELIAPTPGLNIYAGGIKFEPDLSNVFKKTNVQAGSFSAFFTGAVGNGVPSTGGSHISFLAGGGVKYNVTSSLSWQSLQAQYGRFGSNQFVVISTGLSFIFDGQK